MNKTNAVKWLGLVGSIIAGSITILGGDAVTGGGIIAAALSSASLLKKESA